MQSYFPTGQIFFQPPEILTSQSLQYNVKRILFTKKGKIKSEYRMVNLCNSETKGFGELCKLYIWKSELKVYLCYGFT